MQKISDIIHDIVMRQPFLEEALHHGYLNLTGFAEYIRPHIEKVTQKTTSVHAIKMALSRMDRPESLSKYLPSFHASRLSTVTNLSLVSVVRSSIMMKKIHDLFSKKLEGSGYCAIIEGSSEIDIIFDASFQDRISETISEDFRVLEIENLALCSLRLDDTQVYQKWLFYEITKQLAFHGINIIQVISTYHEFWVIIRSEDLKNTVIVLVE